MAPQSVTKKPDDKLFPQTFHHKDKYWPLSLLFPCIPGIVPRDRLPESSQHPPETGSTRFPIRNEGAGGAQAAGRRDHAGYRGVTGDGAKKASDELPVHVQGVGHAGAERRWPLGPARILA